jgi:hypothetical protein
MSNIVNLNLTELLRDTGEHVGAEHNSVQAVGSYIVNSLFLSFYLALKEVIRNRGRFFLVSLVIALITLLVLFIAALGEGLANGNRQYVATLDAQLIVFLEKSD